MSMNATQSILITIFLEDVAHVHTSEDDIFAQIDDVDSTMHDNLLSGMTERIHAQEHADVILTVVFFFHGFI